VLPENVAVRVSRKFYATGEMVSNEQPDPAVDPGPSGAQVMRRVSSSLNLRRSPYESNEVNEHRQISDMRLGKGSAEGELQGELSPGTYFDDIEAVLRGTAEAGISRSNTEFTSMAADNTLSTFTVGGSTWAAQGFRVGDIIRPSNLSATANNDKNFQIVSLAGAVATVYPEPATMGADTSFTVVRPGLKCVIPTRLQDFVKRKVAFEHYYQDASPAVAELFTECRYTRMAVQMPAEGMVTVSFGVMGRGKQDFDGSQAPFFASPAAASTSSIFAATSGHLIINGVKQGVITGFDFTVELASQAPSVAFQDFAPEVFTGRARVSGTISAYFEGLVLDGYFRNETEISIVIALFTTTDDDSPFVSFAFPRVKLGGADKSLQGDAGVTMSIPFTALFPDLTTGIDQSEIVIGDSQAT
jgi:hypothetical protein